MVTWYDKDEDVLNIQISPKKYWKSIESPEGIVIDIAKDGTVISFEIPCASRLFSGEDRKVLEAAGEPPEEITAE